MKTRNSVSAAMFIATVMRHYKAGGNQSTAARELGCTPAAVCLRIKYLRGIGVPVPKSANETRKVRNKTAIRTAAVRELKRWM